MAKTLEGGVSPVPPSLLKRRAQETTMEMRSTEDAELELRRKYLRYIKANSAFVPKIILDEMRPKLDFGLLMYVKYAIEHLIAHARIDPDGAGNYAVEGITDHPAYCVQQAAVDLALFKEFAKTQYPLLNAPVFSDARIAADALLEEFVYYDRDNGEGASGLLLLFWN